MIQRPPRRRLPPTSSLLLLPVQVLEVRVAGVRVVVEALLAVQPVNLLDVLGLLVDWRAAYVMRAALPANVLRLEDYRR